MVISYNLYTRNPEDIKEVTPYAIASITAFLEQQGCVFNVSYDKE